MPRSRVLSFMSQWGGNVPKSPGSADPPTSPSRGQLQKQSPFNNTNTNTNNVMTPSSSTHQLDQFARASPTPPRTRADSRPSSRPISMVQTYQPPLMEVAQDTLPELQRIFTHLNSHSNKLYQEGYFLKLHDLDSRGRPSPERVWTECFAQLVGTVLSLWDAAQLDVAGEDGEVVPTFINLADASLKMIESLPMNTQDGQTLQNVLSLSTAASNRYLLHFNSLHSLTQWTAGIRLSIYENATLQEAYTGSLIAGKGKSLNGIRTILERTRFKYEDWARVRFGAGTPWRRCWFVVSPPDEKEFQKLQKSAKRRTVYERPSALLKGDIKFYESRKITKKSLPIATIKDAYSAYAIYPQAKPLVDQSTLVKIEGQIVIHSSPEIVSEGFVFIMPESHPAVTGFEMMLRFLFPVFDSFALYGRPTRLVADVLDTRSLMFAMPQDRRFGYLDVLDVAGLIHTEGSSSWSEREWRKRMKDLTSKRMTAVPTRTGTRDGQSIAQRHSHRSSLPSGHNTLRFGDGGSASSPSTRKPSPTRQEDPVGPQRVDSAPAVSMATIPRHQRSVSEAHAMYQPSRLSYELEPEVLRNGVAHGDSGSAPETPPLPPPHAVTTDDHDSASGASTNGYETGREELSPLPAGMSQPPTQEALEEAQMRIRSPPLDPVSTPPAFVHAPSQKPPTQPYQDTELRRANSQVDPATLSQLADASHKPIPDNVAAAGAAAAWRASPDGARAAAPMDRPSDDRGAVDYVSPQHQYHHLHTIPASPYVDQYGFVAAPAELAGPPVPIYGQPTSHPPAASQGEYGSSEPRAEMNRSGQPTPPSEAQSPSRHSITRKPLPTRALTASPDNSVDPGSPASSLRSLRDHFVDQDALDQMAARTSLDRVSTTSSNYDQASASTPDYASTKSAKSADARRSVERPRTGVLRTVGNADMTPTENAGPGGAASASGTDDLPTIDFGPTMLYRADGKARPGTSGTITQASSDAADQSKNRFSRSVDQLTRIDNQADFATPERVSPGLQPHRRAHSTSPGSPGGLLKEENRRSLAWQPGMVNQGAPQHAKRTVDAEEWVQQRAAAAAAYSHAAQRPPHSRSSSNNPQHTLSRNSSGDWSQSHSQRPPSRPLSRGPSTMMNPTHGLIHGDFSQHLSAREQEHVARATGTPFLNRDRASRLPEPAGLVGAIEAREREKQSAKEGRQSMMVQHAIAANIRQQQQQQAQQQAHAMAMAQARAQAQAQAHGQNFMPVQQYQQQFQTFNGSPQLMNGAAGGGPTPPYNVPVNQQGYFGQHVQGYQQSAAGASPGAQSYGYAQQQQQQGRVPHQPYGASFLLSQQQQQAQQGLGGLQHRRSGNF